MLVWVFHPRTEALNQVRDTLDRMKVSQCVLEIVWESECDILAIIQLRTQNDPFAWENSRYLNSNSVICFLVSLVEDSLIKILVVQLTYA